MYYLDIYLKKALNILCQGIKFTVKSGFCKNLHHPSVVVLRFPVTLDKGCTVWQQPVETCHHWSNPSMEFLWLRWQTWFRTSSIFREKSILVTMNGLEWKCTFHQWPPTELHTFIVLKFKWTHSFYFLKCWKYLTLTWTCYLLWSLYVVRGKKREKQITFRPWTILGRNCDEKQIYTQFQNH